MIKSLRFIIVLILLSLIGVIFIFSQTHTDFDYQKQILNDYRVYALETPAHLSFCGEVVPLSDIDIQQRFDRELHVNTYWQSNGFLFFKRAHKYFPIIEPILASNGVPDDFKYLALIESGLQNISSPAGAEGFWQIMKSTGREMGLEINANVDERYHLKMATQAACDYLQKAKDIYGNWTLAAAAYNAGINGISSKLKKQRVSSYYDLLLTEETSRYIFRILAVKEIFENPKKYGFNFRSKDLYKKVETHAVKVDTPISDLVGFSNKFNINYKTLKIHNPWLRQQTLNNSSRKEYWIAIPK